MKKCLTLGMVFVGLTITSSMAQIVTDKTNLIHLDFANDVRSTLPEITWEYPRLEYTNSPENQITVRAGIKSSSTLKSVSLSIKQMLGGESIARRDVPLDASKLSATLDQAIFLQNGQNYLELIAENEDGGIVKDIRSVIVGMDALADAVAIDRKDYALLFATDRYDNWTDLVNPVYDANAIARELTEKYGFEVKVVENADQDMVFTTLREYAQLKYKPQDQLFIFFAGHGQYDETFGEGYIVARNSLANDPGKNSYISHNRLRNNINNIPCEHIFMAMDVCFGGTFDPVLASSRALYEEMDNTEFIARKLSIKTRKYLTSGSKEYVSDGVRGQHSPFALKFIEALKSMGGDDRLLTLTELSVFMEKMQTTPRFGAFGTDEQGSEFLFISQ